MDKAVILFYKWTLILTKVKRSSEDHHKYTLQQTDHGAANLPKEKSIILIDWLPVFILLFCTYIGLFCRHRKISSEMPIVKAFFVFDIL